MGGVKSVGGALQPRSIDRALGQGDVDLIVLQRVSHISRARQYAAPSRDLFLAEPLRGVLFESVEHGLQMGGVFRMQIFTRGGAEVGSQICPQKSQGRKYPG